MNEILKRSLVTVIVIASMAVLALAQSEGTVAGRIVDEKGAGLAGVKLTITKPTSGFIFEARSDANGGFLLESLTPGLYEIAVAESGFASVRREIRVPSKEPIIVKLEVEKIVAEVSVTASYLSGTTDSLAEIPGSIERLDARTLENSRVFNFSEALRKIVGVNVRDEEGFGLRPNIGIRGTNPTRSTKVLLLEDGMPLSYAPYGDNASYYHPPVERYESVEVLKGSGQIAYGPHTIAGVVNYLTPNPPEKMTFTFKPEIGNRGYINGGAGFGGTFGKFGTIINLNHKRGNGSRENTEFNLYDVANKSVFNINSRNILTAKASFFREDSNLTYTGATESEFAADPRANIFKNDFFNGRRYGFSLQHTALLTTKISLTSSFYSNYFSRDWWRQSSNSGQRPNRLNIDPDCLSIADLNTTCGNEGRLRDYLTQGIEPRLTANFDLGSVRNEFVAGFRIHREDQERLQKNGDLPNSRDGILSENNERLAFATSGFVQHRFIWRSLAVTPGIRVERIEFKRTNRLANSGAGAIGETVVTEFIPGFGVAYSGIRNTTIFAGVHRGFSPPRVEDVVTNNGGVIDLDSELSWNYELGLRTRPFNGIDLSVAAFRNDYKNQIVAASIAGGTSFTNGGRTLQQGFEFSGSLNSGTVFRSEHNFYLRTALTYLPTAEFRGTRLSTVNSTSLLNTYCPNNRRISATSCSISGNRLPYTPRVLLTSSIGYSHPNGIDAFIENVYIGRQFADDLNAFNPTPNAQMGAISAQTYWNATANYRVESWRTTFFVTAKNLLDRTFVVDRSRGILPSGPRQLQAGVKLSF